MKNESREHSEVVPTDESTEGYIIVGRGLDLVREEVVARIRFLKREYRLRGREVLERTGGYIRYHDGVFGVFSKTQLRKLRWRLIRYEVIDQEH